MSDRARPLSPDSHPRVGHELRDVNPIPIGMFAIGMAAMVAGSLFVLNWAYWRLEASAVRSGPAPSPLAESQTPPPPRLQDQPAADMARLRSEENQKLSTYGWTDRQHRVVRIPVDRAIEILAERGLPEPAGPPQPAKTKDPTPK